MGCGETRKWITDMQPEDHGEWRNRSQAESQMTHDGRMFECVGIFWNIQHQAAKWACDWANKQKHMMHSGVTCSTEGNECLRVFPDHHQLAYGKRQPAYDVLYKIIGNDRGHVPLQLSQHDQFPVLEDTQDANTQEKKPTSVPSNSVSQQVNSFIGCHDSIDREKDLYLSVFISGGNGSLRRVTFLLFISPRCILLSACLSHSSHPLCSYRRHVTSFALLRGPANETASPFLPVTSLQQPQWLCTAQAATQSWLFRLSKKERT